MSRSSVVLPAPEGPASARQRPRVTSRLAWRDSAPSSCEISARSKTARGRADDELDAHQQRGGRRDEHRRQRERGRKVAGELRVYGERGGLSDPLKRAGEHERRAELSERAS